MSTSVNKQTSALPVEMQCDTGEVDVDEVLSIIKPDWISNVLQQKYPGVVVEDIGYTRIVAGNATKIWMDMRYNRAGEQAGLPASMILKAGFDRHDPVMLFTYKSEMEAYRDVLPKFPLNSPTCYYAGEGPDGIAALILMEDLCQRNVRFCHATSPLNKTEATAFMESMAVFHAQSWDHPIFTDGSWDWPAANAEHLKSLSAYFEMLHSPASWDHFVGLPRCMAVSKIFHDRDRHLAALARLYEKNAAGHQVMMIGDTHMGNLYIEQDGTPGFLDFQCRIGSWAWEVAYFLSAALDLADRPKWERELIQHYVDTLVKNGVSLTFDEAWEAYVDNLMFALTVWMTNGEAFQTEVVNTAYAARVGAAALEHGTLDRLTGQH